MGAKQSFFAAGSLVALAFTGAMQLTSTQVHAGDVKVILARCSDVHVVAEDAALSTVLKKLAAVLGFHVHLETDGGRLVNVDTTQRAEEIISRIASSENVAVLLEPDRQCPGQQHIVKMWVLPGDPASGISHNSVAKLSESGERANAGSQIVVSSYGMHRVSEQPTE